MLLQTESARQVPHRSVWRLQTLLGAMALYLAAFAAMRLALATSLNWDSAEQMVFSQRLAWGYDLNQPPLYTWLLMGVQLVFGLAPAGNIALNYSLWLLTVALFYLSALRILGDVKYAALASLAPLSMYPIGWLMHESLTHTMLLMACCAAGLLTFCRLADRGRLVDSLLFGVVLGLGVLSKYSFLGFAFCLLGAAAVQPGLRRQLLRRESLLSLGVAIALVLPHLLWLWSEVRHRDVAGVYRRITNVPTDMSWATRTVSGFRSIPVVLGSFPLPLLIVSAILVPGAFKLRLSSDRAAAGPGAPDLVRLIRDMLIGAGLLLALGAIAGGVMRYRGRWMHSLLLFAPIYLVARVRWARPSARRTQLFVAALILFPLGVFATRGAHLILGPPLCGWPCRERMPLDRLGDRVAETGFSKGTIIAGDGPTAGNLRIRFPAARVVWAGRPFFDPPRHAEPGQCLVIWHVDRDGPDPPVAALQDASVASGGGQMVPPIKRLAIPWRLPFRGERDLVTTWAYILFPSGDGRCH